jgi:hypothetical protein
LYYWSGLDVGLKGKRSGHKIGGTQLWTGWQGKGGEISIMQEDEKEKGDVILPKMCPFTFTSGTVGKIMCKGLPRDCQEEK